MTCCAPGLGGRDSPAGPTAEEIRLASRDLGDGVRQSSLSVPEMHCGACIRSVEKALQRLDNVIDARANLTARRVTVRWRDEGAAPDLVDALAQAGYAAHLFEPEADGGDATFRRLLRSLAVAGFAAANIMLLSVSVWSGAEASTRDLFHWISALIAIPTLAYSGSIFFESAWRGLVHGRMNMDVPISIGLILAFALSLYETVHHGEHAYFDAVVTLIFFLLIGRTLDHVMRERARAAVNGLARLSARGATLLRPDGTREFLPTGEIRPGMTLLVAAGERIAVNGRVEEGRSDLDCSIVNGESVPQPAAAGSMVFAGTLNLTAPLRITATSTAEDSFLAEMQRLMEAAEGGSARYRRLADRAAAIYSPLVHLAAASTLIVWLLLGAGLHQAIYIAISVLIITCPCALGLAVPAVQIIAARRLFENGIMVRDGAAMERLAACDHVVLDKTGTLTAPRARLARTREAVPGAMRLAALLAAHSTHPLSRAIAESWAQQPGGAGGDIEALSQIEELPGLGMQARLDGDALRLGRPEWALDDPQQAEDSVVVLSRNGRLAAGFGFDAALNPGTEAALQDLKRLGMEVEILSGDRTSIVRDLAGELAVPNYAGEVLPADKLARIHALAREGRKVLMVGDGINDAPALSAAHASMAPATAADIGRSAADFVYLRNDLTAIPHAVSVAREAGRLIRQNFGLTILYNAISVPVAALGLVTPLVAAIAMSASSVIVIANAMRLGARGRKRETPLPAAEAGLDERLAHQP